MEQSSDAFPRTPTPIDAPRRKLAQLARCKRVLCRSSLIRAAAPGRNSCIREGRGYRAKPQDASQPTLRSARPSVLGLCNSMTGDAGRTRAAAMRWARFAWEKGRRAFSRRLGVLTRFACNSSSCRRKRGDRPLSLLLPAVLRVRSRTRVEGPRRLERAAKAACGRKRGHANDGSLANQDSVARTADPCPSVTFSLAPNQAM